MAALLYPPSVNGVTKQIDSTYTTGDAIITLGNTTNIQNKPGACVINRINTGGTIQSTALWTYIEFTGTSGNTLTGCSAIAGDQNHAIGEVVEFVSDVTQQQRILDALGNLVNTTTLALDTTKVVDLSTAQDLTNKTLTSPVLNTSLSGTAFLDEDDMASNSAVKTCSQQSIKAYVDNNAVGGGGGGMSSQAIINGNFDVWQRGTSTTNLANAAFYPDHWYHNIILDGGTNPTTITYSRQSQTPGDLQGSYYFYRISPNGAGSSFGNNSANLLNQRIEFGTRNLCGLNKTVTVSFYARSSIANKKLGIFIAQNYGTGGSPSSQESINGETWTLTSSWVKYTHTFTTNTLVGKTFGTANDDFIQVLFAYQWGSGYSTLLGGAAAESFVGSGNIDIAQVQLCAGSAALPFQPKSYDEELKSCLRYCYALDGTIQSYQILGSAFSSTGWVGMLYTPVKMRKAPVFTGTATDWELFDPAVGATELTSFAVDGSSSSFPVQFLGGVASGLTTYRVYFLRPDSTLPRVGYLSAEL